MKRPLCPYMKDIGVMYWDTFWRTGIQGIAVQDNPEGREKIITETSGIQITPLGKKFLKSSSFVGRVSQIISDILPK